MQEHTQSRLEVAKRMIDEKYENQAIRELMKESKALYDVLSGILMSIDRIEDKIDILSSRMQKEEVVNFDQDKERIGG